MLDFRKGYQPRTASGSRDSMRLFLLVTATVGVLWLAVEARNPELYGWIWNLGGAKRGAEVDTRFVPSGPAESDTFIVPPAGDRGELPTSTGESTLTAKDLAAVRDDEPFRAAEQGAWFKLLDRLRRTDAALLRSESIGPVSFIQLFRQPREHRGELVTLAGTLRRAERLVAPRNDQGIESYYQTWLFPLDNPTNPIVVYTLEIPEGFPLGMLLEEQVELEGFFFKRWPYAAQDTVRSAPVVLAKSLRWMAARPKQPVRPLSPLYLVAVAAVLAAVFVTIALRQITRPHRGEAGNRSFDAQALARSLSADIDKDGPSKETSPEGYEP